VAGYALPATFGVYPGIGKAAEVLVGLAFIGTFGVVGAGDYGGLGVHADFEILNRQGGRIEMWILDVGEELGFVADLAIVFGVNEVGTDHAVESAGIVVHLRFIPQVLHDNQFGLLRVVSGFLGGRAHRKEAEK
jgi:hypothetical protein